MRRWWETPRASAQARLRKAARLLLYRGHYRPGVKGWELARQLGSDYVDVVRALNNILDTLGLEVIAVDESGEKLDLKGDLRKATFVVVLKEQPSLSEARTSGWRIDDLAILSASLLYLYSKGGSSSRGELVNFLRSRFRGPRLSYALGRLVRLGYLEEEGETVKIGWRSKIEVDLERLVGGGGSGL